MQKKYDRIYLIDCENVGFSFFTSPNDLVYYFTNESVSELPFQCNENEIHMCLKHTGCKDALDFVIDTYLGYLIRAYGKNTEYFIISNDKGYDNVSAFWQQMGYNVYTNPHKVRNRFEDNVSKKYFDINPANDIDAKIDNIPKNIFDGLSIEYQVKINNIYASWARSKKKERSVLNKDMVRCLHSVISKKDIGTLVDYFCTLI